MYIYCANTKQIIHKSVCIHTCNFFFTHTFLKHENIWEEQNKNKKHKKTTNPIQKKKKKKGVMIYSNKIVNTWY